MLASIPGSRVLAVQLSDGPAAPIDADYATDTMNWRVPPGEGTFDLVDLIRTLDDAGSVAPLSAEVCGHTMWSLSPADAAQRLHRRARQGRAQARSGQR